MPSVFVRDLGVQDYQPVFKAMQDRADARDERLADEIWLLEHPPVYTLGRNGKPEHLLNTGSIPVVKVDRGGQVTYHGPGQLVAYLLLNIKRRQLGVRQIVTAMEQSVIALLAEYGVDANARPEAPGVYVDAAKIAALGLRIKNGMSYHGLSLNVDMDLAPFLGINPCGYQNLRVTQLADLFDEIAMHNVKRDLVRKLTAHLGYNTVQFEDATETEIFT